VIAHCGIVQNRVASVPLWLTSSRLKPPNSFRNTAYQIFKSMAVLHIISSDSSDGERGEPILPEPGL
jgi:hypothetical protein